jgi:hypothetical protein
VEHYLTLFNKIQEIKKKKLSPLKQERQTPARTPHDARGTANDGHVRRSEETNSRETYERSKRQARDGVVCPKLSCECCTKELCTLDYGCDNSINYPCPAILSQF